VGINGAQRLRLIQDLAEGVTLQACADKYGYSSTQAVHQFKVRNREAVEKAKAGFEDEMQLLWVTKRTARIAQYQNNIERLEDIADLVEPDKLPNVIKTQNHALRSVAEEMGHLNQKDVAEPIRVELSFPGVDTDAV
jgi:uncharacterized small protein (DUF1192 family)